MRTDAARAGLVGVLVMAVTLTGCTARQHSSTAGDRYLALARPANEHLDDDFDALAGADRNDLPAARADLASVAAVERSFDHDVLGLGLPGPATTTARALVTANEARAQLTEQASKAQNLADLHAYDARLDAANDSVEDQVRALRRELGLPPPDTS